MQGFFNEIPHDNIETVIGRDGRHIVVLSRRLGIVLQVIDIVFWWSSLKPDDLSLSVNAGIFHLLLCGT